MSDIWLIRHAEARLGPSLMDADYHLTRRGQAQARRLGRFFAAQKIRPVRIWHSTMTRACETARILAEHTPALLKADANLIEFGTRVLLLDCSVQEAARRFPRQLRPDGALTWVESRTGGLSWSYTIGGETLRELHRRARTTWTKIAASAPAGKTVFVVAHASYLSALLTEALGLPLTKTWRFQFAHAGCVRVKLKTHGRTRIPVLCAASI